MKPEVLTDRTVSGSEHTQDDEEDRDGKHNDLESIDVDDCPRWDSWWRCCVMSSIPTLRGRGARDEIPTGHKYQQHERNKEWSNRNTRSIKVIDEARDEAARVVMMLMMMKVGSTRCS